MSAYQHVQPVYAAPAQYHQSMFTEPVAVAGMPQVQYSPAATQVHYAAPPAATIQYGAPPEHASAYYAAPTVGSISHDQAVVKMTLGDWIVAEDMQGEFYQHTPTGANYDHAPPELLQLLQQVHGGQSVVQAPGGQSIVQAPGGQSVVQAPTMYAAPAPIHTMQPQPAYMQFPVQPQPDAQYAASGANAQYAASGGNSVVVAGTGEGGASTLGHLAQHVTHHQPMQPSPAAIGSYQPLAQGTAYTAQPQHQVTVPGHEAAGLQPSPYAGMPPYAGSFYAAGIPHQAGLPSHHIPQVSNLQTAPSMLAYPPQQPFAFHSDPAAAGANPDAKAQMQPEATTQQHSAAPPGGNSEATATATVEKKKTTKSKRPKTSKRKPACC